jgi:hypothetical protein
MTQRVPTAVARLGGWEDEWFAIVSTPIRVRFVEWAPLPWRCEIDGKHPVATCEHELAAQAAAAARWADEPTQPERGTA